MRGALRGQSFAAGESMLSPGGGAVQKKRAVQREGAAPARNGGALPGPLADKMSDSFGTDLSDVSVHQDGQADALGAKAFARGSELHFARGAYDPASASGQELIGHELTHVVQQRAGRVATPSDAARAGNPIQAKAAAAGVRGVVQMDASLEREADDLGARAARGEQVTVAGGPNGAAGDGVVQGFIPQVVGLAARKGGTMVLKAGAYAGARVLAEEKAVALIESELPKLERVAMAALDDAVKNSPEVRAALAKAANVELAGEMLKGLVTPLAQEAAAFLEARAGALVDALSARFPGVAALRAKIADRKQRLVARLGKFLPLWLLDGFGDAVRNAIVQIGVHRVIDLAGTAALRVLAREASAAVMAQGAAAIKPVTDTMTGMAGAAKRVHGAATALGELAPKGTPQGYLNRKALEFARASGRGADVGAAAERAAKAAGEPSAALAARGSETAAKLEKGGLSEAAEDLATAVQVYQITSDVVEQRDAAGVIDAALIGAGTVLAGIAAAGMRKKMGAATGGSKAGGILTAVAGVGAGIVLGLALRNGVKKLKAGKRLARVGRKVGQGDGAVSTGARFGYAALAAGGQVARVGVRGIGLVGAGVKSLVTGNGEHFDKAGDSFDEATDAVGRTGETFRENMDPKGWQGEAPEEASGAAGAGAATAEVAPDKVKVDLSRLSSFLDAWDDMISAQVERLDTAGPTPTAEGATGEAEVAGATPAEGGATPADVGAKVAESAATPGAQTPAVASEASGATSGATPSGAGATPAGGGGAASPVRRFPTHGIRRGPRSPLGGPMPLRSLH